MSDGRLLGIKRRERGRMEADCGNNSSTFPPDKVQKQHGFKSEPVQQATLPVKTPRGSCCSNTCRSCGRANAGRLVKDSDKVSEACF